MLGLAISYNITLDYIKLLAIVYINMAKDVIIS
jgi:hypothetical protein